MGAVIDPSELLLSTPSAASPIEYDSLRCVFEASPTCDLVFKALVEVTLPDIIASGKAPSSRRRDAIACCHPLCVSLGDLDASLSIILLLRFACAVSCLRTARGVCIICAMRRVCSVKR